MTRSYAISQETAQRLRNMGKFLLLHLSVALLDGENPLDGSSVHYRQKSSVIVANLQEEI